MCALAMALAVALGTSTPSTSQGAPNIVATPTKLGMTVHPYTFLVYMPQECIDAGIVPTTLILGTTGTGGSNLVLATPASEQVKGNNGNDCLVGGGGDDAMMGQGGMDVCIGGPGTDTFVNCAVAVQ